jgi:hypothetical protein
MTRTATEIAQEIAKAVDTVLDGKGVLEDLTAKTKSLWEEARRLGLEGEVGRILQDESLKAMADAMRAQGIDAE